MARRRPTPTEQPTPDQPRDTGPVDAADVFDAVIEQAKQRRAAEAPPQEPTPQEDRREARPRSYTGQRVSLPDGTVAHYRDHGNRDGVVVRFDLPEGVEKPADGVTEPLKERREGRAGFVYKGKGDWHKQVGGYKKNPIAERLDAEDRFAEAVKRQRQTGEQDGPGR